MGDSDEANLNNIIDIHDDDISAIEMHETEATVSAVQTDIEDDYSRILTMKHGGTVLKRI